MSKIVRELTEWERARNREAAALLLHQLRQLRLIVALDDPSDDPDPNIITQLVERGRLEP